MIQNAIKTVPAYQNAQMEVYRCVYSSRANTTSSTKKNCTEEPKKKHKQRSREKKRDEYDNRNFSCWKEILSVQKIQVLDREALSLFLCVHCVRGANKQAGKKKRVRARQCRARKQALCSPYLLCWFSKVPYLSMGWFECAISKRQRAPSRNTARADKKIKQFYFIILILFQQFVVVFIFIILLRSERYILYTYRFSCLLRRAVCVCVRLRVCVFFSRLFCS